MVFFSTWIWDCICLDTWIGFHWGLIVLLFCVMFHVVEVHRQLVSVHRPTICWKSICRVFLRSKPYLPQGVQVLGGSLSLSCKGMWLQLGRYCSKWVNNPASLLNKIQFPLSWKQSKRSISLSLSVFILLPALIMLNLFPLLWCFLLIFASFFLTVFISSVNLPCSVIFLSASIISQNLRLCLSKPVSEDSRPVLLLHLAGLSFFFF